MNLAVPRGTSSAPLADSHHVVALHLRTREAQQAPRTEPWTSSWALDSWSPRARQSSLASSSSAWSQSPSERPPLPGALAVVAHMESDTRVQERRRASSSGRTVGSHPQRRSTEARYSREEPSPRTMPTTASHRRQWWSPSSSCSDRDWDWDSRRPPMRTSGTREELTLSIVGSSFLLTA